MPLLYEPNDDAWYPEGESLCEQEHADACDINKMIARGFRGLPLNGSLAEAVYGLDDTNMTLMDVKTTKDRLESELTQSASEIELPQEAIDKLPPIVREKFKFKATKKPDESSVANNVSGDVKPPTVPSNFSDGGGKAAEPPK